MASNGGGSDSNGGGGAAVAAAAASITHCHYGCRLSADSFSAGICNSGPRMGTPQISQGN